jgi:hypothetical protein
MCRDVATQPIEGAVPVLYARVSMEKLEIIGLANSHDPGAVNVSVC